MTNGLNHKKSTFGVSFGAAVIVISAVLSLAGCKAASGINNQETNATTYNVSDIGMEFGNEYPHDLINEQRSWDEIQADIDRCLAIIVESPGHSSNPGDYVESHRAEADRIVAYGDETLPYLVSIIDSDEGLQGAVARILALEINPDLPIVSELSPDGKYCIKTYGVDFGTTSSGLYSPEGIHLVETDTDKILWKSTGFYKNAFSWSPDSKYVAVSLTGRIYGLLYILDINSFTEIGIPDVEQVREIVDQKTTVSSARLDSYFSAEKWIDNDTVQIKFEWNGDMNDLYYGTFDYHIKTKEMTNLILNEKNAG